MSNSATASVIVVTDVVNGLKPMSQIVRSPKKSRAALAVRLETAEVIPSVQMARITRPSRRPANP
jgi:hypothetical protein